MHDAFWCESAQKYEAFGKPLLRLQLGQRVAFVCFSQPSFAGQNPPLVKLSPSLAVVPENGWQRTKSQLLGLIEHTQTY